MTRIVKLKRLQFRKKVVNDIEKYHGWRNDLNTTPSTNKMDAAAFYEDTGETPCFRELKWEAVDFPYYVGEMCG